MNNDKIMSEEAFNEIVEGFDIVGNLSNYGRKSIKYHIKKLQNENKILKENNLSMQREMCLEWQKNECLIKQKKELRKFIKEEIGRLMKEYSFIYEQGGQLKTVNDSVCEELIKILEFMDGVKNGNLK